MATGPEACIDCDVCVPECPLGAIAGSPEADPQWAKINAELAPGFKKNPPLAPRPADEPPRNPGHKLVR
jgi:ferredoxin